MSNSYDKIIKENIESLIQPIAEFMYQLGIFSRIRKLSQITLNITESMPITYNIQKDYLYQQGIKIGKEQLLQTFIQQLTVKFPQMPDEEIAGLANTTADHVKQIRNELAKNAKKK